MLLGKSGGIAGRNINNLKYADNTTLMAESKEELKSLLMKVKKESEKADLKLNIPKTKIMEYSPITINSWQIDEETMETGTDFIFLFSNISADGDFSHEINSHLLLGSKAITNLDSIFGEGNGNPLQCSLLESPRDRGAWWAAVYGDTTKRPSSSSSSSLTNSCL